MGKKSRLKKSKQPASGTGADAANSSSEPSPVVASDNSSFTAAEEPSSVLGESSEGVSVSIENSESSPVPDYGLFCRVHAWMYSCYYPNLSDVSQRIKYRKLAIDFAKKAIQMSPNNIEYSLFFVNLCFTLATDSDDCFLLRQLCEEALSVQNPVDLPDSFRAIHCSRNPDQGISGVQSDLRDVIQKVNHLEAQLRDKEAQEQTDLEEKRRNIELRVAAARLEQQKKLATSLDAQKHDDNSKKSVQESETEDQKKASNEEVQEQKPHPSAKSRKKRKNRKKRTLTSEALNKEVLDPLTQPSKGAQLIAEADRNEQPENHSSSLESGENASPSSKNNAPTPEKKNASIEDVTDQLGKTSKNTPTSKHEDKREVINEEEQVPAKLTAAVSELEKEPHSTSKEMGKAQKVGTIVMDVNADWVPTDDGIHVSLPSSSNPSREEIAQYIDKRLYGPSNRVSILDSMLIKPPAN